MKKNYEYNIGTFQRRKKYSLEFNRLTYIYACVLKITIFKSNVVMTLS